MPTILVLSSHVATSRVGGGFQSALLERMGVETILVPTVLFGRHPGLGAPGGGPVAPAMFEDILAGVEGSGALAEVGAVLTGYFADPAQVRAAARLLRGLRPEITVMVDPIMGDRGRGLYVSEAVAEAIAAEFIPLSDLVAPNAWELERLSGLAITGPTSARAAARSLGVAALVSSVDDGPDTGVLYVDTEIALYARHQRLPVDPKGAGDQLKARFLGLRMAGHPIREALETSVAMVAADIAGRPLPVAIEAL